MRPLPPLFSPLRLLAAVGSFALFGFGTAACSKSEAQTPQPADLSATNRELARAFVEDGLNAPTAAQLDAVLTRVASPSYIQHNPLSPPGRAGVGQFIAVVRLSFPDARFTLREALGTPDHAVARWTFDGTLTGQPFLGIAAKGQKVDFDVIDEWTVRNGQLYEHWDELRWERALVQLGVPGLPAPFVAVAGQPISR